MAVVELIFGCLLIHICVVIYSYLTHTYTHPHTTVAAFIGERDGTPADPEEIFLTNGASEGVRYMMQSLVRPKLAGYNDGILVRGFGSVFIDVCVSVCLCRFTYLHAHIHTPHTHPLKQVPIPQYPLYSALTTLLNGNLVPYYLQEEAGWALQPEDLVKVCVCVCLCLLS